MSDLRMSMWPVRPETIIPSGAIGGNPAEAGFAGPVDALQ
jgi:hypothetical protein